MLFIKSKIQFFESKSQLNVSEAFSIFVVYQVKDTIFWKQITTVGCWLNVRNGLFIKSKIQFFESKSQQHISITLMFRVVYQVKDTIFWKQITTVTGKVVLTDKLFIKSKIQFFESKSQLNFRYPFLTLGCLSSQRYNFLKANHNCLVL